MNTIKIVAIALVIGGALGLAYGNFSYTHVTQEAKLGPLELAISEQETVNIPTWLGLAAISMGVLLLFAPKIG